MGEPGSGRAERRIGGWADIALAVGVAAIVGMMIVPLPTPLLDLLIATNLSLAVIMLLVATYARGGLSFAVLPTALLLSTLYRLALNISSTRLILLQADAGEVIDAFGQFVVRGNYVVGAVVFAILTLVQFIVVARGAERVAEVGARFSLDAMPGRQLAIDADLRAGVIDVEQARRQRLTVQRESEFYGAMDGAMKFVRGDAIAGLIITAINVIAGVAVGSALGTLSVSDSLRVYGLLAIGDGLVSQLPALVTSIAAGIVVTRVSPDRAGDTLGGDMARQLFGNRRVLWTAAGLLLALAAVPGLPAMPFAVLAVVSALCTRLSPVTVEDDERGGAALAALAAPLPVPIEVRIPSAAPPRLESSIEAAAERVRGELQRRRGLHLPAVSIVRGGESRCEIRLHELTERTLSLDAGQDAQAAGSRIAEALLEVALRHPERLVDPQVTRGMLDALQRAQPARLQHLVPAIVSPTELTAVLRRLAAEGVSIRPLAEIVDAIAEQRRSGETPEVATERVRLQLGRRLTHDLARDGVLTVHPLDPLVEDAVREAIETSGAERYLALSAEQADDLVRAVERVHRGSDGGTPTVVLTQTDTRPHVRALLRDELPEVAVVSYAEVAHDLRIDRRAPIAP